MFFIVPFPTSFVNHFCKIWLCIIHAFFYHKSVPLEVKSPWNKPEAYKQCFFAVHCETYLNKQRFFAAHCKASYKKPFRFLTYNIHKTYRTNNEQNVNFLLIFLRQLSYYTLIIDKIQLLILFFLQGCLFVTHPCHNLLTVFHHFPFYSRLSISLRPNKSLPH